MIQIYFKSKKDILYFFVIWGTIAIGLFSTIISFFNAPSIFHLLWGLPGLIIAGFFIWLWFGTGYKIENDTVTIQFGLMKKVVNIQDIHKIKKEKSVWSAAALATDRLVIQYGRYNWEHIVSPKKEQEFIKLLLTKNPKIQTDMKLSELYKL